MNRPRLQPLRATLHPAFLVAVAVLLVNDQALKGSELAGVFTGKASDFAGLFFAPVLLAAILGVGTRRALWGCGAAVGFVFAAINLSAEAAAIWDAAVSTLYPFHTTVDPTDLFALVSIPVGLLVLEPSMNRDSAPARRRALELAVVTTAALGSIATAEPCTERNGCLLPMEQSAQVSILNKTNELHVLRIRFVRPEVEIDCDIVREAPAEFLNDAIFGPPETWFVQSGQEIPIDPNRNGFGQPNSECGVALVESDQVENVVVFWESNLETKFFPFDADIPPEIPADPQTIVLDADYSEVAPDEMHPWRNRSECGERADLCDQDLLDPLAERPTGVEYFWRSQNPEPLHFERTPIEGGTIPDVPELCRIPSAADSVSWADTPGRTDFNVVELEEGVDGCHRLRLRDQFAAEDETESWWLCVPFDSIAFLAPQEDGTTWRIAVVMTQGDGNLFRGGYEGIRITATELDAARNAISDRQISVVRGFGVPDDLADFGFQVRLREGCEPFEAECGQVGMPVDVFVEQFSDTIPPGESRSYGEVLPVDLYIVRAEYRPVRDSTCDGAIGNLNFPESPEGLVGYIETVIVSE